MNHLNIKSSLVTKQNSYTYYSLTELEKHNYVKLDTLPYSIRILLENLLRNEDGKCVTQNDIKAVCQWSDNISKQEIPFMPARVLMQDFTGVPAIVDLAAMREAVIKLNQKPSKINPLIPTELVIDHSVQVDMFGCDSSIEKNTGIEYERNKERYAFLRWGQKSLRNFKVVPPATGICHQLNLEYLARVAFVADNNVIYPDTVVGLDSHTTMINGIGVMGWGVGGIEAEAVMLGQPYYMLIPKVVGVKLTGKLPEGITATDLVLTITEKLRKYNVVGMFVEFCGPGVSSLSVADRATVANMAPEYGATMGYFPVDSATIDYLHLTGRNHDHVSLIETYFKAQKLFRTDDAKQPTFSELLELDMSKIKPCLAGPRRPQDRIELQLVKADFLKSLKDVYKKTLIFDQTTDKPNETKTEVVLKRPGQKYTLDHGAVVIASITSCTNTSNPSVLIGAGLLAKNAVKHGLTVQPWVKTSFAPGSKVATLYLKEAGLMPYLEALRFHTVAYGCATCIGNSGAIASGIANVIKENQLVVAAVLSSNRNFEGRVNPLTRANYLASPILVVAYALAGTVNIDFETEPIANDPNGDPVFLKDIWPSQSDIDELMKVVKPEMFVQSYKNCYEGDSFWQALPTPESELYEWDSESSYIKHPTFFKDLKPEVPKLKDIQNSNVLVLLGDSVTTDHISPAGTIPLESPAARYLEQKGVKPKDFNSYGSRRGNHEVMMRGTFGNVRLKNQLVPNVEGGWTIHVPSGNKLYIYDAAMQYQQENIDLIVLAGKEYGTGSSRDWAAKGTFLLGVKAVIAESFERIHRSNLIGMGVLPLQFIQGQSWQSLGLTGKEKFDIKGIKEGLTPQKRINVIAYQENKNAIEFQVIARIDSGIEAEYYQHGGILQYVLRKMIV